MTVFSTATAHIPPRDSGIASATVTTAQQIGGSLGAALLNTIATTTTATYLTTHHIHAHTPQSRPAIVHGYTVAIWWAVGAMLLATVLAALLITCKAYNQKESESQERD